MDVSPRVSPLRQRMIDDMRMRKLSEKTQTYYSRWVQLFAVFLGRSPDAATVEDLRGYQLRLVDSGTSQVSLNASLEDCATPARAASPRPRTPARQGSIAQPLTGAAIRRLRPNLPETAICSQEAKATARRRG